jgi:hypothetical protein
MALGSSVAWIIYQSLHIDLQIRKRVYQYHVLESRIIKRTVSGMKCVQESLKLMLTLMIIESKRSASLVILNMRGNAIIA